MRLKEDTSNSLLRLFSRNVDSKSRGNTVTLQVEALGVLGEVEDDDDETMMIDVSNCYST